MLLSLGRNLGVWAGARSSPPELDFPAVNADASADADASGGGPPCSICGGALPSEAAGPACGCGAVYCDQCLVRRARNEIDSGHAEAPRCPTVGCGTMHEADLARVLPDGLKQRRERLALLAWAAAARDVVSCPAPDCAAVYALPPDAARAVSAGPAAADAFFRAAPVSWGRYLLSLVGLASRSVSPYRVLGSAACDERMARCEVPGCAAEWCVACGEAWHKRVGGVSVPHDGRSCAAHRAADGVSESVAWIRGNTRPCPGCSRSIEKNGGCPHMRCAGCKANFCWTCMKLYEANGRHVCGGNWTGPPASRPLPAPAPVLHRAPEAQAQAPQKQQPPPPMKQKHTHARKKRKKGRGRV